MQIILGTDNLPEIEEKYIVLELDQFQFAEEQEPISAFALIENVPIMEMTECQQWIDLHKNLIKNYRLGNFKFCEDAIEYLVGKWNKEIDSFYLNLSSRISGSEDQEITEDWTPVIKKFASQSSSS